MSIREIAVPFGAYSIDAFAKAFGQGRSTVYREIAAGNLRAVKSGGRTMILARDADAWAASLPAIPPKAKVAALA
jgi:excisionase family DNA binding protein